MFRTRIKICGLTREQDVEHAIQMGADAIGFVFYSKSPRYISPEKAAHLVRKLPPFMTSVGLFVNSSRNEINAVLDQVPLATLQLHGDETPEQCNGFSIPIIKVARVQQSGIFYKPEDQFIDLVKFAQHYPMSSALLVDAFVEEYGGVGKTFDWSLIPAELADKIILSGGLNSENVACSITALQPYGVDVSSGVEREKGIKDSKKMQQFFSAVRDADASKISLKF